MIERDKIIRSMEIFSGSVMTGLFLFIQIMFNFTMAAGLVNLVKQAEYTTAMLAVIFIALLTYLINKILWHSLKEFGVEMIKGNY